TGMLRAMPPDTAVLLLVGPGNNGGDALQAGRLLARAGFDVRASAVASLISAPPRAPDAAAAWAAWRDDGMSLLALEDEAVWPRQALVVDGLFGIGLTRGLPSSIAPLLDWIARSRAAVLAIDVPSGINADTGEAVEGGRVVRADVTVTMIADKPGLHTGLGLVSAGRVVVALLTDEADASPRGHGTLVVRGVKADAVLLDSAAVGRLLPTRRIDAHKGTSGDVLVIGGRLGMAGAGRLAARGALAAGAGKVWIAGDPAATDAADPSRPEIMRNTMTADEAMSTSAKVIVIGCGLGQDRQAKGYLEAVTASGAVMVCDADALNLVSAAPRLARLIGQRGYPTILTPHPLEAARLLAWPTARVQADRITAAVELAKRFEAVVALKGAGTVVADASGHYAINTSGNPVLASGGTGDVLAGIIAALAAGLLAGAKAGKPSGSGASTGSGGYASSPKSLVPAGFTEMAANDPAGVAAAAACAGVWLHGAAADLAARRLGPAGVPAGVIADLLPLVLRRELQTATCIARAV
ncbi:MAG TPA: NAD(P)H-hydrate dehydratase, partial [Lautropia sp.]|nr:NAD(P)H-hydrate dehydratase [Lautropia sp.]